MRQIVEEIEKAAGHVLGAQGLTAVYVEAGMPDSEDDSVDFVNADGAKSIVSVQVSSRNPSLGNANVNIGVIETREIDDGWTYVDYEGVMYLPPARSKEALMAQLVEALEDNAGSFDLSQGNHPRVITHPLLGEALLTVDQFAGETGSRISVRPFKQDEQEGLEIVAEDGRTIRIEAMPGALAVISAGERSVLSARTGVDRSEMLACILAGTFSSTGMRP